MLAFILTLAVAAPPDRTPPRPNVLLIVADDLGYADLGFQGSELIPTPHLDALAKSGVVCSSGYSTHPFCSPMRAALLTGRYQQRFGYEENVAFDLFNPRIGLPPGERTVGDRLSAAGYDTALIGKWHLGASHAQHPNARGFEFFHGFQGGGHDYFAIDLTRPVGEGYRYPLVRNERPATFEGYLTDALTDVAVEYLQKKRDRPFFLVLAYNAPHTPLQAPPKYLDRIDESKIQGRGPRRTRQRKTYAAMVAGMDEGVGRAIAALEERGLRGNTLVAFMSDNGGPENSNGSDNGPLRGAKGDVYEGGVRVPFCLSMPGRLPAGRVYKNPVASIDLTRTAVALANGDQTGMEGVDLMGALAADPDGAKSGADDPLAARPLFWRKFGGEAWAVRVGNEKLLDPGTGEPELYDLAADLGERRDLAGERPGRVAALKAVWDEWNAGNRPPAFPGFRDYIPARDAFHRRVAEDPQHAGGLLPEGER